MNNSLWEKADNLIKICGTNNPEEICKQMNITVVDTVLPASTKGFCLNMKIGNAIVVNNNLTGVARKSCIAHELGHLILHEGLNFVFMQSETCMVAGKYERQANCFAAAIMLNGADIKQTDTVNSIAKKYCLTEQAVEWVLK